MIRPPSQTLLPSLLWTSPLSHVKQPFVLPNESTAVVITFPVCHTDPLWCCLFRLYRDNSRLLRLIRVLAGQIQKEILSIPHPHRPHTSHRTMLREEVRGTAAQLASSHPITAETKRLVFFWAAICLAPVGASS